MKEKEVHIYHSPTAMRSLYGSWNKHGEREWGKAGVVRRLAVVGRVDKGIALGNWIIPYFPLVFTQGSSIQIVSSLAHRWCRDVQQKAQGKAKQVHVGHILQPEQLRFYHLASIYKIILGKEKSSISKKYLRLNDKRFWRIICLPQ